MDSTFIDEYRATFDSEAQKAFFYTYDPEVWTSADGRSLEEGLRKSETPRVPSTAEELDEMAFLFLQQEL